jgi:hypothetical protein
VSQDRFLRDLYDAFNARDVEAALAAVTEDVDWPNAWEGGRVNGKDAMRSYWTRQWAEIDPRVEPVEVAELDDGRVAVAVEQTVLDLDGGLIAKRSVRHVYTLRDGLVARMDVEE